MKKTTAINRYKNGAVSTAGLSVNLLLKIAIDTGLLFIAYISAFLIRFDFKIPEWQLTVFFDSALLAIVIPLISIYLMRINQSRWRYSSVPDLLTLFLAISVGWIGFVVLIYFTGMASVPRSVLAIYWMLGFILSGAARLGMRIISEARGKIVLNRKRVLVIGAGNAGEMIIRQMKNDSKLGYCPVGIIDDDPKKRNTKIHGVKVLDDVDNLQKVLENIRVDEIIIAAPSARPLEMQRIVHACEASGVEFKTVPGPRELINGHVEVSQIRKVKVEDLLDRRPVEIELEKIRTYLEEKVVLITGAAGSIGSELSRQILQLHPKAMICLDRNENNLFFLDHELDKIKNGTRYEICIADILDQEKIKSIMEKERPDIIFHAAAFKHVPLMESHPEESLRNNVLGTVKLIELADKYDVEKFVLISTDKAVNPTSIMGASKRLAELILQSYSRKTSMRLLTVRFGNVLGSLGSVIPLFQKQIAEGGPVTITHPDMKRFFMTIPESVKLILESSRLGEGNEIFILDMGEPIRLINIAKRLIKLSGFEPDKDILIKLVGIRPGEKLEEELWNKEEIPLKTDNPKILMALGNHIKEWEELRQHIDEMIGMADSGYLDSVHNMMKQLIPEYNHKALATETATEPLKVSM